MLFFVNHINSLVHYFTIIMFLSVDHINKLGRHGEHRKS